MPVNEKEMPDALWKSIVSEMLPDFIDFFIPSLFSVIDFDKGFQFLDNELDKITRKLRSGRKYTDRLVKVWLKDGAEQWILIHVEIQGYHDDYFSERMFMMFYRIFDKFYKKIVALAIFTEGESGYKPNSFDYNYFFTQLHYEYFTYKILEQKEEDLKKSDNPFAMAVLAGLYTLKTETNAQSRYSYKKKLSELLKNKGYDINKITNLMIFLDGLMFLPENLEIKYESDVRNIFGGEKKMVAMKLTNIYKVGENKGRREGKEEGIEEGKKEEKKQTAYNLMTLGVDLKTISEATGLPKEEIEKLKDGEGK